MKESQVIRKGVDVIDKRVRTRKTSERINKNMLKKIVMEKKGMRMYSNKPLTFE